MITYSDGFFSIDPQNGFLPQKEPLATLPIKYVRLQQLIEQMPVVKSNGDAGLLATEGAFESQALILPNYLDEVNNESDTFVLAALFRAYSFVASAYTLAPAHHNFLRTGKYGKAHDTLPSNLAQPFATVAQKLDVFPWLDYHFAYSLGNYHKIDPSEGYAWTNLEMSAKFSGKDDERGFIMLHVDINQYSPQLIEAVFGIVNSANDSERLTNSLKLFADTLHHMNDRRKLMWEASRWKHYNDFRVFIMGIKGNDDIFPNGLLYEGVWEEPKAFRGQTGAQDNIIPTADIVSGVIDYYPQNQLTKYLLDLRQYRPKCVQHFFHDLEKTMKEKPLMTQLINTNNQVGMIELMRAYEEIYLFRNGHWQFVQKYIMQNTAYPKATGGTPITSWIPNQIKAVLSAMHVLAGHLVDCKAWNKNHWQEGYMHKVNLLNKQLKIVAVEAFDPKAVFDLNLKHGYRDF